MSGCCAKVRPVIQSGAGEACSAASLRHQQPDPIEGKQGRIHGSGAIEALKIVDFVVGKITNWHPTRGQRV